jgi:uncharacterized membrane protein
MKVFGHPLHPATVHLPFGLLACVPLLDVAGRLELAPVWALSARTLLELGLLCSIPALLTGMLDLASLGSGHRSLGTAFLHLTAMGCALGAYGAAWLLWGQDPAAPVLCWVGLLALLVGGACGGHLVYVHGVTEDRS